MIGSAPIRRRVGIVVPSLGSTAARDEVVVGLLLVAGHRADASAATMVTVLAVDGDLTGWSRLQQLIDPSLSTEALALEPASTPNPFGAALEAAHDLLEHLTRPDAVPFDELHVADRGGIAHYALGHRRLGLGLGSTTFVVHLVGGTLSLATAEDRLVGEIDELVTDHLERSSVERADVVVVHDDAALAWYRANEVDISATLVHAAPTPAAPTPASSGVPALLARTPAPNDNGSGVSAAIGPSTAAPLAFFGRLAPDGGLGPFCDAVDRLTRRGDPSTLPAAVLVVGEPGPVGGIDAVTYLRTRARTWPVPLELHRDLAIADEVALLQRRNPVVVCDDRRRQGLRSRLAEAAGLTVVRPTTVAPGPVADRLAELLHTHHPSAAPFAVQRPGEEPREEPGDESGEAAVDRRLRECWRRAHPGLVVPTVASVPPLERPHRGPLVSVCVTHHERPDKLRTALRSIEAQSYRDLEVIVVDDGSREPATVAELARIETEFAAKGWRLLRQENAYLGAARNTAAHHARGEYVLFMDDDNAAKPDLVATMVAVAQRDRADVVTSFYDGFEVDDDLTAAGPAAIRFTPIGPDPTLGLFTNCFGDANALWRRTAFEELGGFGEDYGITHEDWELFCRAQLGGRRIVCVPQSLFWYRIDAAGMFRGSRRQLHEASNHARHLRPFLHTLPAAHARLAQLSHGNRTTLARSFEDPTTRSGTRVPLRHPSKSLPFARVAVIMRTKDRPLLLERAVRSVVEQTFGDWLLVIVNDGGDPASVRLVVEAHREALAGRLLIVDHASSLGMQSASNVAISRCDSEFVTIHDDDDAWEPTFLERLVGHLDRRGWDPMSGGVVCRSTLVVEQLTADGEVVELDRYPFDDDLSAVNLVELASRNLFPPISLLFRRTALDEVGHFDERFGPLGDWDFHLRLAVAFDVDVIPERLANYHHRPRHTSGNYGNSVHDGEAEHRERFVTLVNDAVRRRRSADGGDLTAELLVLGQFGNRPRGAGTGADRSGWLTDQVWTIDQRVGRTEAIVRALLERSPERNLVVDGDFRTWRGLGPIHVAAENDFAYAEITSSTLVCFGEPARPFEVTCVPTPATTPGVRTEGCAPGGLVLPIGKRVLQVTKPATRAQPDDWFALEFDVALDRGLPDEVTVSLTARLDPAGWVTVTGRHELATGQLLGWGEAPLWLDGTLQRYSVTIACPPIADDGAEGLRSSRMVVLLPAADALGLALTDVQVEAGPTATPFAHRPPEPPAVGTRPALDATTGRAAELLGAIGERITPALPALRPRRLLGALVRNLGAYRR